MHGAAELKAKDCLCSCPWLCRNLINWIQPCPKGGSTCTLQSGWVASWFCPYSCSAGCLHQWCGVTDQKCSGARGMWKLSLSHGQCIADLFSTPMESRFQFQVAHSRLSGGIRSITCILKQWRSKSDKFYLDENNEFNLLQNNGSFSGKKLNLETGELRQQDRVLQNTFRGPVKKHLGIWGIYTHVSANVNIKIIDSCWFIKMEDKLWFLIKYRYM